MITLRIAPLVSRVYFVFIFLIAFLALTASHITIFSKQLSHADILLLVTFFTLLPLAFKNTLSADSSDTAAKALYFILLFAFASTFWGEHQFGYWYTFYQLMLTFLTISIPLLVSKVTNDKFINYHKLISNFSTMLSLAFLLYIFRMEPDGRLAGSLGSAAIISVIMVPVLAVHFHNILHRKRMLVSVICFFVTLLSLFYTQSRAGLLMLVLFIAVTLLRKPTIGRILVIGILATVFFFTQNISVDRYDDIFEDSGRTTMFNSAVEWWMDSPVSFLVGNGYGSIWPWAAHQDNAISWWTEQWIWSEHGMIMYHAHSVFNQMVGELGIVGLIAFLVFLYCLFRETFRSWIAKNELKTNILVALICTLPTFFTDLMIFRNWEVSIVWLFFFFTALKYTPDENRASVKSSRAIIFKKVS